MKFLSIPCNKDYRLGKERNGRAGEKKPRLAGGAFRLAAA
jgi:hypothetical protein